VSDSNDDAEGVVVTGRWSPRRAELDAADERLRDVLGRLAFELATTPEGRIAGLSVEVWPGRGVLLRARTGHELRVLVERRHDGGRVIWERSNAAARDDALRSARGSLGGVQQTSADELRAFIVAWLASGSSGSSDPMAP